MAQDRIIRPAELVEMLGISIPTLYRWEAKGKLPIKKHKLGPRTVGFLESDVLEWIENSSITNLEEVQI